MNLGRKAFDRFISILLSVLLMVSIMPLGAFSSVMAAGEDFIKVNAGETELYLFGAETAEATLQGGYYVVTYTGGDASASGVYVNGSVAAVQDGEISYGDSSISFSAAWLENQTGWIAVKCASEAVIPAQEPQETLPEINDVTVTPFNDRYDGSEHDAVTVTGTRQGDVVTYSVNDGEFTNVMPKLREPGTVQITVKVQRTGYEDFIYSCTAIMANGEISWYDVTPYEGTYDPDDPTAKPAVIVTLKDEYEGFDTSMDKIEYSVDGGKTYSDVVPTIEKPGEINVEVRITRSNYDAFNYKVTAKMANATIEGITVTPYSGIYDEKAHGVVTSIDGLEEGDTVLYSLTGDEGSYTEDMPTITDAGSLEFYVRIKREYHDDYVSFPVAFSATVKKAQLPEENIEAKGITDRTWSLNIFFNPLDSVTVEFKNGLNRDDFKITYYDLNGRERDTPVLVYTTSQNGLYKVKIEHISGNYEPLIIENILVALNRATQEIFFEDTPDEIIYGENNKFQYVIDDQRFADESEGKITYSIDSNAIQNGATIDKDTGEVTFTKAGQITVTATREQDSKYAAAYKTYTVNVVYVDTPEFEATLPQYSDGTLDWYSCEENTDGYVLKAPEGWEIIKGSNAVGQNGWSSEISETTGGVYDNYTIAFRNIETGAITDVVTLHDFAIDDTTPNIQEFVFKDKNTGVLPTILRTLTFGLFWNEAVEIEVTSNDGGQASSGIKSIKLYKYNKDGEIIGEVTADSFDSETGRAVFTIEPDFEGTIGAEVEDNVGRASGKNKANNLNSNIGEGNLEGYIMLENTPPVLSDVTSKPIDGVRTEEVNGNVIYSGDAEFSFTASDGDSGLYEVGVKINGQTVGGYPVRFNTQVKDRQKYTFTTEGIEADENGMFTVEVTVEDNAGNVTGPKTVEIYRDNTAATISGFEFSLENNIDVSGENGVYGAVDITDYGFYFKENVTVTINAEDLKAANETASGVGGISYRAINIDGTVQYSGDNVPAVDGSVSFNIDKDFKGQIYAMASDAIGNTPANSNLPEDYDGEVMIADGDLRGYVHPNGSVVEHADKHRETSSIEFTAPAASGTQGNAYMYRYMGSAGEDASMDYDPSQKVPLYNYDPTFGIAVEDTFSGIRELKWTLTEGSSSRTGTIYIDNAGTMTGDTDGWTATAEENSNLITALENQAFAVSGNYNNMVLLVELTDRAGNMSYDYYAFGIDKTAPVIDVRYTNNSGRAYGGNTYFNADRTAEITIAERNFNPSDVIVNVTKDGAPYQVTLDWRTSGGSGNGDDTAHTAVLRYGSDGDYTFSIEYTDMADNGNNGVDFNGALAPQAFTIDKTAPVISVRYNNNRAQNAKYFNAARTATIVVTEHNFDVSLVNIAITAALNGSQIAVPNVSWRHNGDTHTATISYSNDGDYTFDISARDLAGNSNYSVNYGSSIAAREFTIDKSISDPVIAGVENGRSYKDDMYIDISFSDINFDEAEIRLLRTRKNEIDVDVTEELLGEPRISRTGVATGRIEIPKLQENDGIYRLSVTMRDKAGNEVTELITFTLNRFGSVYEFGDYLADLNGSYVQKVDGGLVITEYNPDRLISGSLNIQITRDGVPLEDVKYTVTPVINEFVPIGESGWYQYEYVIDSSNFTVDGVYKVTVQSEDTAGNMPETDNYEDCDITFMVDTTPAEIVSIAGLERAIINAESQTVQLGIFDAIGIKKVTVYVNDSILAEFDNVQDIINFTGEFAIGEGANQHVRIVVEDLAGNVTDTGTEAFEPKFEFHDNITISTNFFVRWYANKLLFWGAIALAIAVIVMIIILIIIAKRRKREEEEYSDVRRY